MFLAGDAGSRITYTKPRLALVGRGGFGAFRVQGSRVDRFGCYNCGSWFRGLGIRVSGYRVKISTVNIP